MARLNAFAYYGDGDSRQTVPISSAQSDALLEDLPTETIAVHVPRIPTTTDRIIHDSHSPPADGVARDFYAVTTNKAVARMKKADHRSEPGYAKRRCSDVGASCGQEFQRIRGERTAEERVDVILASVDQAEALIQEAFWELRQLKSMLSGQDQSCVLGSQTQVFCSHSTALGTSGRTENHPGTVSPTRKRPRSDSIEAPTVVPDSQEAQVHTSLTNDGGSSRTGSRCGLKKRKRKATEQ